MIVRDPSHVLSLCYWLLLLLLYCFLLSPPPLHSTRISLFLCPQARTIMNPRTSASDNMSNASWLMTQELRWNSWHSSDTPVFWIHVSAISCLRLGFFAPLFYCWRHAKIYFTKLQFLLSCPTVQPRYTEYK